MCDDSGGVSLVGQERRLRNRRPDDPTSGEPMGKDRGADDGQMRDSKVSQHVCEAMDTYLDRLQRPLRCRMLKITLG